MWRAWGLGIQAVAGEVDAGGLLSSGWGWMVSVWARGAVRGSPRRGPSSHPLLPAPSEPCGFEPTYQELASAVKEEYPDIEIESRLGGTGKGP